MSKFDIIPPYFKEKRQPVINDELTVNYGSEPNIINDTAEEIKVLKNAFKSNMDKEREKKDANINPNFWFAVYFQDEEQKNEFLSKIKANNITEGVYINGLELAKLIGVEIKRKDVKPPSKFKSFRQ